MIDLEKHAGGRYLTIHGRRYYAEREGSAVYLTKCGSKDADTYQIAYTSDRDGLSCGPNAGLECECRDFRNRHRGTGSPGCKHIQALSQAGLLPQRPEEVEPDSDDRADDYAREYRAIESAALASMFSR